MPKDNIWKRKEKYDAVFDSLPKQEDTNICAVEDCSRPPTGRGFCRMHYARITRYGRLENLKKGKSQDPNYETYLRIRKTSPMVDKWRDDFWAFTEFLGVKPSPYHFLKRKDEKQPHGPDNSYWCPPPKNRQRHENGKIVYLPATKDIQSRAVREKHLKREYNLTLDQYDELLSLQGGGCAICGINEEVKIQRGKKKFSLGVDHNHDTGAVRGILCDGCNRGLGYFQDNAGFLIKASEYLKNQEE